MNLQVLHQENCGLNRILLSSFIGFVNLNELYLSSNKLRTVEKGSLTLYRLPTNIRYLELSHNNLEDLPHTLTQLQNFEGTNIRYYELRNVIGILLLERHVRHLNISNNPWGCLSEACDLDAICGNITYQAGLCGRWNERENEVHCVAEDIVPIISESSIGEIVVMRESGERQQGTVLTAGYVFMPGFVLGVLCTLLVICIPVVVLQEVNQKEGTEFDKSAKSCRLFVVRDNVTSASNDRQKYEYCVF